MGRTFTANQGHGQMTDNIEHYLTKVAQLLDNIIEDALCKLQRHLIDSTVEKFVGVE
jgi:hypothetical protein